MSLTIAIPTMRRWDFLKDSLPVYLARDEVAEVILCDETGEDAAAAASFKNPKLRIVVNERRLGIYENKRKVLGLAKTTWVALLDSDNYFSDEWFDTLLENLKTEKVIYASADFNTCDIRTGQVTKPCKRFSGLRLDKTGWNSMLDKPGWPLLLNDGNWVLPRDAVEFLPDIESSKLAAVDALYMLRCFVKAGYTVWYVPKLEYIHIVHDGSSWLETERESNRILSINNWSI
jgi:glycosyltransferase involved in cell wall biosynthesis